MIEKLIGDVGPVSFALEKPPEDRGVLFVANGVVPAEPVQGTLAGLVRTIRATLADALQEMAGNRFIEGGTEPVTTHTRLGGQFSKRDLDLLLLWSTILIAPP